MGEGCPGSPWGSCSSHIMVHFVPRVRVKYSRGKSPCPPMGWSGIGPTIRRCRIPCTINASWPRTPWCMRTVTSPSGNSCWTMYPKGSATRAKGRTILTELESKQIFAAYGIPTVDTRYAATADDAVKEAAAIGYPVVIKLNSETITHKSDVKGGRLWSGPGSGLVRPNTAESEHIMKRSM